MPILAETRTDIVATSERASRTVVTGASAGVGRAVAQRFAGPGVSLGLIARNEQRLAAAVREVEAKGGAALACPLDVADAAAVEAAAARIEEAFGPIDIWINAAMTMILGPVSSLAPDEVRRATEVTYLGFVYGTMAAWKRMWSRNQGVIVQVGSGLACRSVPLQAPYCGAKHAMIGFTDALRSELIHERSNVKIGVVHLPGMNTPQFDWGRNKLGRQARPVAPVYQPEVAAEAIHYMAHNPRREIWLTWTTWKVMLGQKFVRGYFDRYLARNAWSGQMTDEALPDQPGNLFETVDGDFGAHGRFDREARTSSSQLTLAMHPVLSAFLAGG
jgi:short-subunit dehydrogenase